MGTKCAPSYANLFMGKFEKKYIYNRIKNKSKLYLRFIDDIFIIWTASKEGLLNFIQEINQVHQSIKFTVEYSENSINFLDTMVYISNNRLFTKVYKKPTDRLLYLHKHLYHPENLKWNIPYGQALRLRKICTNDSEHHEALQKK